MDYILIRTVLLIKPMVLIVPVSSDELPGRYPLIIPLLLHQPGHDAQCPCREGLSPPRMGQLRHTGSAGCGLCCVQAVRAAVSVSYLS